MNSGTSYRSSVTLPRVSLNEIRQVIQAVVNQNYALTVPDCELMSNHYRATTDDGQRRIACLLTSSTHSEYDFHAIGTILEVLGN